MRASWVWAGVTVLALRVGLGMVMGGVWLAVRSYVPAALRSDPTLSGGRHYGVLAEAALSVWARWDAVHYLTLARVGYFGVSAGDSVFYPLYPALVRLAAFVTAGDDLAAGLIVSSLAAVVAFAMLYQLTEQAFGADAARWSIVALAVYLALNLIVFFSKRSPVAASLQSLARYVLALFPAFIVAGDWLARRGSRLPFVAVVAGSIGLMILSVGYSLWWFIG